MSTLHTAADRRSPGAAAARSFLLERPTLLAALLCLASFTAFWAAQRAANVSMIDLMVYRAEGWAVRSGQDLYSIRATHAELPATYPPFAALLFMPLTLLDVAEMRTLATLANLLLLIVLIHLSLHLTGRPLRFPRPAVTLVLASVAVWCEPVWTTLRYGQVNLLLAALVLWDLSRRPGHRWAGVGTGIAAGIKLTPALFAVVLALCGIAQAWRRISRDGAGADVWNARLRQACVATGAFLVTAVLSAVVLPRDSHRFWTDALLAADRVGNAEDTANQSLRGVAARLLHTGDPGAVSLALSGTAAVAGLAVAAAALLAGPRRLPHAPAWSAAACAATALLVSPFSWSHHWVWCVPLVLLLGAEALRRGSGRWWSGTGLGVLVFCSYALWWVPHSPDRSDRLELRQSGGEMLLSGIYPLAGAAFLVLAATVSLRALLRPAPYEPDDHARPPHHGHPRPSGRPGRPGRRARAEAEREEAGGRETAGQAVAKE